MKKVKQESIWDVKKVAIFSFVVILVLLFLSYRVINLSATQNPVKPKTTIKPISAEGLTKNFQETLSNLKQEANGLDVEEVASSSPQVQKIINDLKSLKDVPKSQLKNTCENICKGL